VSIFTDYNRGKGMSINSDGGEGVFINSDGGLILIIKLYVHNWNNYIMLLFYHVI